jgi:hypothetical protein
MIMTNGSMLIRCLTISTAVLLFAPAHAQTQTQDPGSTPTVQAPATPAPAPAPAAATANTENAKPGFMAEQSKDQWLASKNLIGAKVTGPTNETVGSINDLLVEKDGKITAAVIGVGGFLGIGQKNVAVPFNSLQLARDADNNDKVAMPFTKDELKQAPDFTALAPVPPKTAAAPNRPVPPGTGMAGPGGPADRH